MTVYDKNYLITLIINSMGGGGAERVTLSLARELVASGYNIEIVIFKDNGKLLDEAKDIAPLFIIGSNRVAIILFLLTKYLINRTPKIIISALTLVNIVSILALKLSFIKSKIIIVEHSATYERSKLEKKTLKSRLIPILIKITYPMADVVAGVSEGVLQSLLYNYKIKPKRKTVLYNPIDVEKFQNYSNLVFKTSQINHRGKEVPFFLAAGRLELVKDYSTLLKAFHELLKSHEAKLIILGEGSLEQELKDFTIELGIQEHVSFPGFVTDIYSYMCNSDIFVLTSVYEGMPTVLLEAMACGTPVISSNCPYGPNELIQDGVEGYLYPVGDYEQLAKLMRILLNDKSKRSQMGEHAYNRATVFSIERSMSAYKREIEFLIKGER